MILLRHVELRSRLCRVISLSKVRVGAFDPTIREFSITDPGVGKPFESVQAVLDNGAHESASAASPGDSPSLPGDGTGQPE